MKGKPTRTSWLRYDGTGIWVALYIWSWPSWTELSPGHGANGGWWVCMYMQVVSFKVLPVLSDGTALSISKVRKDLGVKITSCFTHTQPRLIAVHGPLKCSVIKQIKAELLVNYGSTLGIVMSRCPVVCERLAVLSDGCTSSLSVNWNTCQSLHATNRQSHARPATSHPSDLEFLEWDIAPNEQDRKI